MSVISTHFFHQVQIFFLLCTALLLRLDSKPTVNSRTYQLALVLDCEQSLFSQSSLSSAELERAKWLRGKLERGGKKLSRLLPSFPLASLFFFTRFAWFPCSCDHPEGLPAVYTRTSWMRKRRSGQ